MIYLNKVYLTLNTRAGPVNILRGISLFIKQGESIGLIGPSGSGKSTLMAVIAGLERQSSGTVSIAGQTLDNLNEDELATFRQKHVGIVFQSFHLIPTMTAIENVAVASELGGDKDAFNKAEIELNRVGLSNRLSHYPAQLSGGEQQRVAIARAIVRQPRLILADEPTGNLDDSNSQAIMKLLLDITNDNSSTLILITHDEKLAARCNRIIQLTDGAITLKRN